MSQVVVEMSGQEAALWQSIQRATQGFAGMQAGIDKTSRASREAAREQETLGRAAKKVFDDTRTPQEQYNRRLAELDDLLKRDKISQETYNRAVVQAGENLVRVSGAARDMARATAQAEEEERRFEQAAARAFEMTRTPLERYNQRLRELDLLLQQGRIDQETYNRAVRQAQQEFDAAGRAGQNAFGPQALGMLRTFVGALGIGTGLAGALQLVRKEWESVVEAQNRALEVTKSVAETKRTFLVNLMPQTAGERDTATSRIEKIAAEKHVSERDLFDAAANAISAKGDLPIEAVYRALEMAATIAPGNRAALNTFAGIGLDVQKFIPGASPEDAIGLVLATQQKARVTDPAKMNSLVPAMRDAMARGATAPQAAALFGAFTQSMVDESGDASRTAEINFVELMRRAFTSGSISGKAPKPGEMTLPELQTLPEQLAWLHQQDPETRKRFAAEFNKRRMSAAAKLAAEQIIMGDTSTGSAWLAYDQFAKDIPDLGAAGKWYRQGMGVIAGDRDLKVAGLNRTLDNALDQLAKTDQGGAETAAMRGKFGKILQQLGDPALLTRFREWNFEMSPDKFAAFRGSLAGFQRDLQNPQEITGYRDVGPEALPVPITRPRKATREESQRAQILGDLLAALDRYQAERNADNATENSEQKQIAADQKEAARDLKASAKDLKETTANLRRPNATMGSPSVDR